MTKNYNSYVVFILGFDKPLRKLLKSKECDVAYNECISIARKFHISKEYKNTRLSLYDALYQFIKNK